MGSRKNDSKRSTGGQQNHFTVAAPKTYAAATMSSAPVSPPPTSPPSPRTSTALVSIKKGESAGVGGKENTPGRTLPPTSPSVPSSGRALPPTSPSVPAPVRPPSAPTAVSATNQLRAEPSTSPPTSSAATTIATRQKDFVMALRAGTLNPQSSWYDKLSRDEFNMAVRSVGAVYTSTSSCLSVLTTFVITETSGRVTTIHAARSWADQRIQP